MKRTFKPFTSISYQILTNNSGVNMNNAFPNFISIVLTRVRRQAFLFLSTKYYVFRFNEIKKNNNRTLYNVIVWHITK